MDINKVHNRVSFSVQITVKSINQSQVVVLDRTFEGDGPAATAPSSSDSSVIVETTTPKHLRRTRLVHYFLFAKNEWLCDFHSTTTTVYYVLEDRLLLLLRIQTADFTQYFPSSIRNILQTEDKGILGQEVIIKVGTLSYLVAEIS